MVRAVNIRTATQLSALRCISFECEVSDTRYMCLRSKTGANYRALRSLIEKGLVWQTGDFLQVSPSGKKLLQGLEREVG